MAENVGVFRLTRAHGVPHPTQMFRRRVTELTELTELTEFTQSEFKLPFLTLRNSANAVPLR